LTSRTLVAAFRQSAELARLKTLAAQNNASVRALEGAEAAARRDELSVSAAQDRLRLAWGRAVAEGKDLAVLANTLAGGDAALVRVRLPVGATLKNPPAKARLFRLAEEENLVEAEWLGELPAVDAQTQGRSFLFLVQPNAAKFVPGLAVTGLLAANGAALRPASCIVRLRALNGPSSEDGLRSGDRRKPVAPNPPGAGCES
jgi:hypothetical protein